MQEPNEVTEAVHRYCDELTQWVPTYQVKLMNEDHLRLVRRTDFMGLADDNALYRFQADWTEALAKHVVSARCMWEGSVDPEATETDGFWHCPRCGARHEDVTS